MALERIGVMAVVEGASSYRSGAAQVTAANQQMASSSQVAAQQSGLFASKLSLLAIALPAVVGAMGMMAVTTGVQLASMLEQSEIGFTTMLGSAEKAKAFLKELQTFAAATPFQFKDLVTSSQQLIAMGFAAEEVLPMLEAIGDTASGLGAGAEGIHRITRALGQMRAKGKVSAEEMMQLGEMGVPAWEMLAKAIGTDIPTAMKMAEKGALKAADVIPKLVAGMSEKFGGLMEAQSKTLTGMLSNVTDYFQMAMAMAVKPALPMMKEAVAALMNFLSTAGPQFSAIVASWVPAIEKNIRAVLKGIQQDFVLLTGGMKVAAPAIAPVVLGFGVLSKVMPTILPTLITMATLWGVLKVATMAWGAGLALVNTTLVLQIRLLAIEIGAATSFGAALAGVGAVIGSLLTSWQFWLIALAAVDIGLRAMTGSGLLDWITGAAIKQRRHAEALKEVGDAQQRVNQLVKEGITQEQANAVVLEELAIKAQTYAAAQVRLAEWERTYRAVAIRVSPLGQREAPKPPVEYGGQAQLAENLKVTHDAVMALNPTYKQLADLTRDNDVLTNLFSADLKILAEVSVKALEKRFKDSITAIEKANAVAKTSADVLTGLKTDYDSLGSSVSNFISILSDQPNTTIALLKVQQANLQSLKDTLGTRFTKEQENQLQGVNAALAEQEDRIKGLGAALSLYANVMVTAGGNTAEAFKNAKTKVEDLEAWFAKLPAEQQIAIEMLLPEMDMLELTVFLANLEKTHDVNIAFKLASGAKAVIDKYTSTIDENVERFAGSRAMFEEALSIELGVEGTPVQDLLDLSKVEDEVSQKTADMAGNFTDVGSAAEKAVEPVKTLFEILKDRADIAMGLLSNLRNAFSNLFSQPTKETAQINARLAGLRLQRAQMVVGGATDKQLKSLDDQIASVQKILDLRQAEQDVIKSRLDLVDQSLLSDAEQIWSAGILIGKMGGLSVALDPVITLYQDQATAMEDWKAGMVGLLGLSGMPAAGGQSWTIPSMQYGGIVPGPVGSPQPILAHGGERISPPSSWASVPPFLQANNSAPNYAINVNAQGATVEEVRRLAHSAIDEAFNRARSTSYRGGAPLSSGIG